MENTPSVTFTIQSTKMNQMNEYSSSVRNATRAATAWAASPVGHLVRVEVLVTVSCGLLATQVFLGSGRRTSRSAAFRLVVLLALMLCYPAVSYTMGLIQSSSFRNDLVVVWACFLIGCADGIFACSVDHSDKQARTALNQATQVLYVLLLLISNVASLDLHLQILLVLLWVLNVTKLGIRLWSMLSDGRDQVLTEDNWLISKYMAHDHVRSVWDFDPETMRGYCYVVTGEKEKEKEEEGGLVATAEYKLDPTDDGLVTVDGLWQQEQYQGISKRDDGRLKDLCLSFALFKLLRRRLSGNPVQERHDMRTQVLVRNGLAGGDSYERMYRVIEVELGFLFDFFYARYPSPKQSLFPETAMFLAVLAVSVCTLLSPALMHYHNTQAQQQGFVTTGLDIWLARFVIVLFLVLELFQYMSLVLSDWHKVKILCRYTRWQRRQAKEEEAAHHPNPKQKLQALLKKPVLWLVSRATLTTRYWSNSVGQYSLLHASLQNHRSCCARMPLHPWIKDLLNRIRTVSRPNLPVTVKRAIHLFVQSDWMSSLMCGDRTLQRINMLEVLDWSTSRYRHGGGRVGSILVWHIATTISAADRVNVAAGTDDAADCPEVATTLSNYCAYLLFHEPELLAGTMTDQIYEMRRLTRALQQRIQKLLKDQACRSKDDMFRTLLRFQSNYAGDLEQGGFGGGYEEAILADGIRLAQQIAHHMPHDTLRWKFLSEMWVELLLSAAPSDNVMIHVKKLATGGELITHIWALLTHAGVIDKPKKKSIVFSAKQCSDTSPYN